MQTQEAGHIDIRRYAAMILRWLWLIILGGLLAGGAAFAASYWSTPIYRASTTLLINETETVTDRDYNDVLMSERLAKTCSQMLQSKPILTETSVRLRVPVTPGMITVNPVRDTQLIQLDVQAPNPVTAAAIANLIPRVFGEKQGGDAQARFATLTVVEPAEVPSTPVLPRTKTNTLLAAVVGAMLGAGMAVLIEYLDDTVKDAEDVERISRLPTFASIIRHKPKDGEALRPVMLADRQSAAAEGFRLLRTNLDFATIGLGHSAVVLLVTSSQPEEGKTTTLTNLGISLAQTGKTVVLVDGDLRRPSLHKHFGLTHRTGLTSLIRNPREDLQNVLQGTKVRGLSILASGHLPANPAEVLAFRQMNDVLDRLRQRADYVLVDSPPLLSVADAAILAQKVDGVLVVAEMGRTRSAAFAHAIGMLEGVKARVLGVVLNKVRTRSGRYGYDYYPSYGYGSNGQKAKRRSSRSGLGTLGSRLFGRRPAPAASRTARAKSKVASGQG